MFYLFFFKQKTAYEMRISDWSSDVCSSDLHRLPRGTAFSAARVTMMMVGRVISDRTMPPTRGAERGSPKKPRKTARPSRPNTTEGTAARLLMLTRSEERRVGKERVSPGRSRWSPYH